MIEKKADVASLPTTYRDLLGNGDLAHARPGREQKSQVFDQDFRCAAPRDVAPRILQFKESRTAPGISPSPPFL